MSPERQLELVDYFLEQKYNGMEYAEMRQLLSKNGVEEADRKRIIRNVDNRFLGQMNQKRRKRVGREDQIYGILWMVAGGVVTLFFVFTLLGPYQFNWESLQLLAGASLFLIGLRRYRKGVRAMSASKAALRSPFADGPSAEDINLPKFH